MQAIFYVCSSKVCFKHADPLCFLFHLYPVFSTLYLYHLRLMESSKISLWLFCCLLIKSALVPSSSFICFVQMSSSDAVQPLASSPSLQAVSEKSKMEVSLLPSCMCYLWGQKLFVVDLNNGWKNVCQCNDLSLRRLQAF